jgi:hypothetical protein
MDGSSAHARVLMTGTAILCFDTKHFGNHDFCEYRSS